MNHWWRGWLALLACLFPCDCLIAEDSAPAFAREAQGDWRLLAAQCGNRNIATGTRVGSRISVTTDGITWHDPDKAEMPLVSATCARVPIPASPQKPVDPNELTGSVRGSLCPVRDAKLAARWRITGDGVLLALVQIAKFEGNRNGTYSGASPADVLLICRREPVPAALPPDPQGDARRLVGKWTRLAELDDANAARTLPQSCVEFTPQEFFKRSSFSPNAKLQMEGTWKLIRPQGERGRIDLVFRSGIEGNQGRSPSLYTFHGEDLLMVVFPEGGWPKDAVEKQELRQPPTHFGSDGSRNMWILQRRSDRRELNGEAIKQKQP